MGNNTPSVQCHFCHKLSNQRKGIYKNCRTCNKCFCNYCNQNPILMKQDAEKYVHENGDVVMTILCPDCFKNQSTIDFNEHVEIIGKDNTKNLLWIHGAMGCRKMFKVHAEILADQGYRSVLIDLPAHGTQMNVTLTIDNCVEHIYKMRQEYCTNPPIAIGGSLGGYMLMQTIKKYSSLTVFSGVAICMASQNVGSGRSLKASLGLFMLDKATKLLSTQRMGKSMLTMAKNINKQISAQFGKAGIFFNQCNLRTTILQQTNSIQGIKNYEGKILFLNGQKDYMDSLQLWLSSAKYPPQSKIYKNSDHFFSHDKSYLKQFAQDIRVFAEQVLTKQMQQ